MNDVHWIGIMKKLFLISCRNKTFYGHPYKFLSLSFGQNFFRSLVQHPFTRAEPSRCSVPETNRIQYCPRYPSPLFCHSMDTTVHFWVWFGLVWMSGEPIVPDWKGSLLSKVYCTKTGNFIDTEWSSDAGAHPRDRLILKSTAQAS